ncbi:MAG TPA: cyclodeaminase/cyclohydrolase family protein [Thermoanaerobaculia bacterium]|nr:cyclodeaminase/cyclohydrolase family protein [Thermoanaerobaculia bacterium]
MTPSLWSWTLAEFRDRSAAGTPTPGGGSVSAVTATLGAGLVVMGLEVTRKGATAEMAAVLEPLLRSGRELLERLSAHADGDVTAFAGYLRACALPRTSEAEKAIRRERMQRALAAATEGPLATGRDVVAALGLARQVMEICKIQVRGDIAAGADILEGSLAAVLRSVDANLPGLADTALRERLQQERTELAAAVRRHP